MHFMLAVSTITICLLTLSYATPVYQLSHEWHLWKSEHKKSYITSTEELERHLIWLSNRKYIDGHNANVHIFGYSLSMNQHGDLVSASLTHETWESPSSFTGFVS